MKKVVSILTHRRERREVVKKLVSILTYRKPSWELCSQEGGGYSNLQEAASKDNKEGGR